MKKPVLLPNAAIASSIPANVLKEGKKQTMRERRAPSLISERAAKKAEDYQVDGDQVQDDKDAEVKVEANKKHLNQEP